MENIQSFLEERCRISGRNVEYIFSKETTRKTITNHSNEDTTGQSIAILINVHRPINSNTH